MSIKTAENIITKMFFKNDFERIRFIKLVLSLAPGASISDLNYLYHLSKIQAYEN